MVQNAIKLAQHHLKGIPWDYKEPVTPAFHINVPDEGNDMDQDPAVLQAHITKKQKVLAILQKAATEPQGQGWAKGGSGGRGGRGGFQRGGRGAPRGGGRCCGRGGGTGGGYQFQRACSVFHKFHPGNPPEDSCFRSDLDSEQDKLDALKQQKQAAAECAKDRKEHQQHHKA
eukprot:671010-Rhodomonas_salina.2